MVSGPTGWVVVGSTTVSCLNGGVLCCSVLAVGYGEGMSKENRMKMGQGVRRDCISS